MSEDKCPEEPADGWNFETLRLHLLGIMNERDKRYDQAGEAARRGIETALSAVKEAGTLTQAAADRAVAKAEAASEKRFESVNEFRNTLADQQRMLMPRSEAEIRFNALDQKITSIDGRLTVIIGQGSGVKAGWGYAVGVAGFVSILLGIAFLLIAKFSGVPSGIPH